MVDQIQRTLHWNKELIVRFSGHWGTLILFPSAFGNKLPAILKMVFCENRCKS